MSDYKPDMKEALGARSKPDLTHCRRAPMIYNARTSEYGSAKYERANYLRPAAQLPSVASDFTRFRAYLRAGVSHLMATLDAMELHEASDPTLEDAEGMRRAAYAADTDAGLRFPASGLPHVAHAITSISMAITQATHYGLLPDDPGQPWAEQVEAQGAPAVDGDDDATDYYDDCSTCDGSGKVRCTKPGHYYREYLDCPECGA